MMSAANLRLFFFSWLVFSAFAGFSQNYFQQTVNYQIDVTLDDENHFLHGHILMEYTNNAPHALEEIFIHAMPNAYQKKTALYKQIVEMDKGKAHLFNDPDNLGFMDSLYFEIDGNHHEHSIYEGHPDVLKIKLSEKLPPGSTIRINTPFRVKIPSAMISRLGRIGQDYMITQWFPKPAVYDHEGWHPYPYLTIGEFFSEFGRFEVNITLPHNYYLGSTGVLQNEEEWGRITRRIHETASGSLSNLKGPINSSKFNKTLTYIQDSIHDFAFFASKTFLIESDTIQIDGKEVISLAMYQPGNSKNWSNIGVKHISRAVKFYSDEVGSYPYKYVTAIDGTIAAGGGMEYPMVTIIGNMTGPTLDRVIAHEVGHNWFYGMLATDERRFPYLDEGMNSHIEKKYMEKYYPNEGMFGDIKAFGFQHFKKKDEHYLTYKLSGSWNTDQPMNLPADEYSELNYGSVVYAKSAVAWDHLRGYLGEEVFMEAMHHYFKTWRFRHPGPEDVRRSFEEISGKDLSWFFEDIVTTTKKVDYRIVSVKEENGQLIVKVQNKGGIEAPVHLAFMNFESVDGFKPKYDPKKVVMSHWEEGFSGSKTFTYPSEGANIVVQNPDNQSIDIFPHNDAATLKGASFRRTTFGMIPHLDNREELRHMATPWLGGNAGDGFMMGLMFHNTSVFGRKFQYYASPTYGVGSNQMVGLAGLTYRWFTHSSSWLENIEFNAEVSRFHTNSEATAGESSMELDYYHRFNPSMVFHFKRKNRKKNFNHKAGIQMRWIQIFNEVQLIDPMQTNLFAHEVFYQFERKNYNHFQTGHFGVELVGQDHELLPTFSNNKINFTYEYGRRYFKDNFIKMRIFSGFMTPAANTALNPFGYTLSAWSGVEDYRRDEFFFNRAGNTSQYLQQEGGFLVHTNIRAYSSMNTVRLKFDLPYLPLSIFGEGAFFDAPGTASGDNASWKTHYSTGIIFDIIPDIFSIGLPLIHDDELSAMVDDLQPKFINRIRFSLKLRELSPSKLLRNIF
ncbi:MAG: M1 family metallopeptidase [Cryomorphaceae bacterium]|nr:M1 family metallopeptidase [Cryomorphaceae bacterium]